MQGLCRTGKLLASYHENIRADIILLGKALSGGSMWCLPLSDISLNKTLHLQCIPCLPYWPIRTSCSASSLENMEAPMEGKRPFSFTHSVSYAQAARRNPLGCAIATTALDILIDERLSERAEVLGEKFRSGVRAFNSPLVKEVRGRGLLNAVVIDESRSKRGRTAWQFCLLLKSRGVLAKPTHVNVCGFICSPHKAVLLTRVICLEFGLPPHWSSKRQTSRRASRSSERR